MSGNKEEKVRQHKKKSLEKIKMLSMHQVKLERLTF